MMSELRAVSGRQSLRSLLLWNNDAFRPDQLADVGGFLAVVGAEGSQGK